MSTTVDLQWSMIYLIICALGNPCFVWKFVHYYPVCCLSAPLLPSIYRLLPSPIFSPELACSLHCGIESIIRPHWVWAPSKYWQIVRKPDLICGGTLIRLRPLLINLNKYMHKSWTLLMCRSQIACIDNNGPIFCRAFEACFLLPPLLPYISQQRCDHLRQNFADIQT